MSFSELALGFTEERTPIDGLVGLFTLFDEDLSIYEAPLFMGVIGTPNSVPESEICSILDRILDRVLLAMGSLLECSLRKEGS